MIAALHAAIDCRLGLLDPENETAFRLLNGFSEGLPTLALDVYARTLVIHDYADTTDDAQIDELLTLVRSRLPWLSSAVLKPRHSVDSDVRSGRVIFGSESDLPRQIRENDVIYSINVLLNRDASFYIDTRGLRAWARQTLAGKRVLNTFAYTGSLGVAARAAPCRQVVTTDLKNRFLAHAKESYSLNGFPIRKADFITGDFFEVIRRMRRDRELFDCVFLDPPFFSETAKGRVDQGNMKALINKVRPVVAPGGFLVVVTNALFISGKAHMEMLEALCAEAGMRFEQTIDVPQDFVGCSASPAWPTDPAPFNHPTKIAVLRIVSEESTY